MGWQELRNRAKQFKQQTDEALANDIKQANLFSDTLVECQRTYECVREPANAAAAVGDAVRLVDMKDRIEVFIRVRPVGYVVPSQTEAMRDHLKLPQREGRAIRGHITEVSELTPTFTVLVGD